MKETNFDKYYSKTPEWQKTFVRQFRATHSEKHLMIDGVDWRYYDSESGAEILLLLHGGFVDFDMWIHQIVAFEKDYRIIAPTCPVLPDATMQQYSEAIYTILMEEDIHQVYMMGYSEGGLIAQCFIREHPELIKKAIFSQTFYPSSLNKYFKYDFRFFRTMPAFITEWVFRKFAHPDKEELHHDSTDWLDWYKSYFRENKSNQQKDYILTHLDLMMDFSRNYEFHADDLNSWEGELLITVSEDDVVRGYFEGMKMLYPQAETHIFPEGLGAHSIALITPQVFNDRIRAFLSE